MDSFRVVAGFSLCVPDRSPDFGKSLLALPRVLTRVRSHAFHMETLITQCRSGGQARTRRIRIPAYIHAGQTSVRNNSRRTDPGPNSSASLKVEPVFAARHNWPDSNLCPVVGEF